MSQNNWNDNSLQFPRLLAEIKMAGLTPEQVEDLCDSMSLEREQLTELLDRAEEQWDAIKDSTIQPSDAALTYEWGESGPRDRTGILQEIFSFCENEIDNIRPGPIVRSDGKKFNVLLVVQMTPME